jgi:hypothetical protein
VFLLGGYVVVGSPFEDVGPIRDAGAVHLVPYGYDSSEDSDKLDPSNSVTITRATLGGTPVTDDEFGGVVMFFDEHLLIGAPGADHDAGRVYAAPPLGDQSGFDLAHPIVLQQGRNGLPGTSEPGDRFGAAVEGVTDVEGPVPHEPDAWLAIGAPGEDVRDIADAGAVTSVPDFADLTKGEVYYQGNGLPGTPERGDHFGFSLAQYYNGLAIGAPGEDIGPIVDAGNVTKFYRSVLGSGSEYHQGSNGVPGVSEAGDHFGAAMADRLSAFSVSIGIPGEDVGAIEDAGAVVDLRVALHGHERSETTLWYQGHNGLAGVAEAGDQFGAAVYGGNGDLIVGVPGEDVGGKADAGLIELIGPNRTLFGAFSRQIHQDTAGIPGTGQAGDRFGASIGRFAESLVYNHGTLDFRVVVGASRKDVGGWADAGAIWTIEYDGGPTYNRELELKPGIGTLVLTQDDLPGSSAEPGDRFGAGLG